MKGKAWGSLTAPVSEGYQRVSAESGRPNGKPSGKFVAVARTKEYATNVVGSHGGTPSSKFIGQTGIKSRHGSKFMPKCC